jgi:dipeptidyl aminopeptidase/acylaminoacyl peptidase
MFQEQRMKQTRPLLAVVFLVLNAFAWAEAPANPTLESAIDRLYVARAIPRVAISPDGTRVAWVEYLSAGGSAIYVADVAGPTAKRTVSAGKSGGLEGHMAWSPDSKHLAFLSDVEMPGQYQLYVADLNDRPARRLTDLTGYLDAPKWAPDGKTIAILFTENAPRAAGPLQPMTVETGEIESKVYEQRLTIVDAASGQTRQISPADMYIHEYAWSPNSKALVATAAPGAGDANWYVAQLYILSAAGGEMKSIHKPSQQIAAPAWSPDGKSIAFIGGLMSDEGSTGGDIFVVSASGGEARDVTPGIPSSPSWLTWTGREQILFGQVTDGAVGFATLDVSSGKTTSLWIGPEIVSTGTWGQYGLSLAADGKTSAVIRQSFSQAPEVWAGTTGEWKQISHVNDAAKAGWGEAKSIHWTSDGVRVQGWLMLPRDYDPKKRYPMIVSVHGGPAAFNGPEWPEPFFDSSVFSVEGYFVFYPNPRGSYGAGEAFTRANVKDFGYGDFRDILTGVDEVVKEYPVDNDRIGIAGWSYGGYMTMWAVTQTDRFHAAVAGAGLVNFQSYYGINDIDEWMPPYFGATVYDDPAVYAKSSPITFIKNVKTPTLVLVGDRDGECPAPQSREFWHALKTLGVETQLVIYPNEGHYIGQTEHQRDILRRMVAWFDGHLKGKQE